MRRSSLPSLLVGLVVGVLVGGAAAGAAWAAFVPRYDGDGAAWDQSSETQRVAVVGDSLIAQARPMLRSLAAARAVPLSLTAVNGAAPCDVLPDYQNQMTAFQPTRVELAFVGNASTPCMVGRLGYRPPAKMTAQDKANVLRVYRNDLTTMIRWNRLHGTVTWLALPPAMGAGTYHGQLNAGLVDLYRALAKEQPLWVRANGVSRELLTPGGVYRDGVTLDGRAVVYRFTDHTHLMAPSGTYTHALGLLLPVLQDRVATGTGCTTTC